jgi:RNA recognition motif-containing protein
VVNGLPWAWTWKELKDLVAGTGEIERADVVYGRDGRRCVGPGLLVGTVCWRRWWRWQWLQTLIEQGTALLPACVCALPALPGFCTAFLTYNLLSLLSITKPIPPAPPPPALLCSRGYGTVRYSTPEEAAAAIEQFNGTDLEGRTLSVRLDKYA